MLKAFSGYCVLFYEALHEVHLFSDVRHVDVALTRGAAEGLLSAGHWPSPFPHTASWVGDSQHLWYLNTATFLHNHTAGEEMYGSEVEPRSAESLDSLGKVGDLLRACSAWAMNSWVLLHFSGHG